MMGTRFLNGVPFCYCYCFLLDTGNFIYPVSFKVLLGGLTPYIDIDA